MISREKFKGSSFNELEFYLSVKYLDLELIQQELKTIQKNVLEQVQDYVNAEYLNFLSLSRDLDFVEEELQEYSREFYKLLDNVSEFDSLLLKNSQEAIKLLQETQTQRVLREKLKEKSLLSIGEITEISRGDLVKGIVLFLELERFYQTSNSNTDEEDQRKKSLGKVEQVSVLKRELTNLLDLKLKESFQGLIGDRVQESLEILFTGSNLLENYSLVANRFMADVLEPWMEKSLVGLDGEDWVFKDFLDGFMEFIKEKVLYFVDLGDKCFNKQDFSLLTDAVWPVFVNRMAQMTTVKNPAHLKDFHCNYSLAMDFVGGFEKLYSDSESITRLRSQSTYSEFLKMWQLSVYYQIRTKEIQSVMESNLKLEIMEPKNGVSCKASQSLLECIESLWAPDIYLNGLQSRALKATFQSISIFLNYITESIKEETRDTSKPEDIYITTLLILYSDLQLLTEPLLNFAKSWPIPENLKDKVNSEMENIWKKDYEPIQIDIESRIVNLIFSKSNEIIKQVRNIPSQFRGTQKETPTKPSLFLNGILIPISSFRKMHSSNLVPQISQKILTQVINRYDDTVSETLNSVSNIEAGLRRFKRTKNPSEVSDEDKIRRQLEIDSEEFKRLVTMFE